MATLQNIRNKGPLLIIVIGLALAAFIIGDFLHSADAFFGNNREHVGEIAGERIHIMEFQSAVEQFTEVYRIETGQTDLSEEIMSQIRTSVWESMIADRLLLRQAAKIGLTVTTDELAERTIGNNPHPILFQRQMFMDENGRFNSAVLIDFLAFLDQDPMFFNRDMQVQLILWRNYWLYWENVVKMEILREKFANLMSSAVVANNIDARSSFDARQRLVNFSYVSQPYFMVPDDVVSVTDREIRDRFNRDRELFRQEASRSINYVVFDVVPLEDDFLAAQEWMDRASEEFRTTDDIIGFINSNSDVMYDGRPMSADNVPVLLQHFAFNGRAGDFFGPVFINNTHLMARLMETGIHTSDSVRLSHIFLMPGEEQLADSLMRVIRTQRNVNFGALARQYSRIPQTAENDGEIGWLVDGMRGIDREFMDAFNKNQGEVYMFSNMHGIQIVQVTEKTAPRPRVRLAILERRVLPSSRSQAQIFNNATQFAVSARRNGFQTQAAEDGLLVLAAHHLGENTDRIGMMPQTRQIVRWTFNANLDNVSDVFDIGDQFIVATVTEVNRKGIPPLERVAPQIQAQLIRERKAEYMTRNIANQLAQNPSLEALANHLNVEVWEANNISFASRVFGASGFEPAVIGSAMNVPMHQISAPITGNSGVFVVLPTSEIVGTEEFDAASEVMHLNNQARHSLPFVIFEDMRRNAEIVDSRSIFF